MGRKPRFWEKNPFFFFVWDPSKKIGKRWSIIVTQLRFFLEGLVLGAVQEEGLHSPSMESLTGATEKHGGEKFDPSEKTETEGPAKGPHKWGCLRTLQGQGCVTA